MYDTRNAIPHVELLYIYISTCAVPHMAVLCSYLMSCCGGMLLRYFVSDFEMVPVAVLLLVSLLFLHSTCAVFLL
jgi:hypothetical protein